MPKTSSEKKNTDTPPAVTTTNTDTPPAATTTVNEAVAPPRVVKYKTLRDTVVNTRFTEQIPAMLITTITRQNGGKTLQLVDENGTVFKVVVQAQLAKQSTKFILKV